MRKKFAKGILKKDHQFQSMLFYKNMIKQLVQIKLRSKVHKNTDYQSKKFLE